MSAACGSARPRRSGIIVCGLTACGARIQRAMFAGEFGSTPARYTRRRDAVERRSTSPSAAATPGMRWHGRNRIDAAAGVRARHRRLRGCSCAATRRTRRSRSIKTTATHAAVIRMRSPCTAGSVSQTIASAASAATPAVIHVGEPGCGVFRSST